MMRDNQQSSLQVETPNNTMALKAMSPVPLKELGLMAFESPEEDLGEENFSLHLSEDEDEERTEKKKTIVTTTEENKNLERPTIEPVSDNLNCVKIQETSERSSVNDENVNNCVENVKSDLCTKNDNESSVNCLETKTNQSVNDDTNNSNSGITEKEDAVNKESESTDKISEQEKIEEDIIKNDDKDKFCKPVEQDDKIEKSLEQKMKDSNEESDKEKASTNMDVDFKLHDDDENKQVLKCSAQKEEKNEDEKTKAADELKVEDQEKTNADILKDQIMDTEDLLQIVENDTEENDKDSLKSGDKADSEDNEQEGDKNDVDEEDEDQVEEEKDQAEEEKDQVEAEKDQVDEEKGDVDIEENPLSKNDIDEELDKEYRNILKDADVADKVTNEESADKMECENSVLTDSSLDANIDSNDKVAEVPTTQKSTEVLSSSEEESASKKSTLEDEGLSDEKVKSVKRSLNETVEKVEAEAEKVEPKAKKVKLGSASEMVSLDMEVTSDVDLFCSEKIENKIKSKAILSTISQFLQKKMLKTLTYEDLEEICMQKICEAICYKSEIGELRHQLGVQEQMAEMWRKEVAQLSKQARDLEIVNKRLLHEVRLKNERDKPLVPVKITRSVGLQVRSDSSMMANVLNQKRRSTTIRPPQASVLTSPNIEQQNRTPPPTRTATPVRTPPPTRVLATTRAPQPARPAPRPNQNRPATAGINKITPANTIKYKIANKASMLTQVLQNATNSTTNNTTTSGNSTTTVPISSLIPVSSNTSNVSTTAGKGTNYQSKIVPKKIIATKGVIDLTDEDTTTNKTASPVNTKSAQGVRIVATNKTPTVSTSGNIGPQSRIMYVYNNGGVISPGNQKVMVKLPGSANGVIATMSNGSLTVGGSPIRTGPISQVKVTNQVNTVRTSTIAPKPTSKHPAPLPAPPISQLTVTARKPIPPKPHLSIKRSSGGIVLSWKMPYNLENYESIVSYQLYAYQETSAPPSSDMWRKVGDVKALALPMACTLTQFADGNKYHFAVRAVDVHKRMGPFSDSEQILL